MMRPPLRAAASFAASALLAVSCGDASSPPSAPLRAELAAPAPTDAAAALGAITRLVPRPITGIGGSPTFVRGMNAAGVVVGVGATSAGEFHAFAWTRDGGARDLGTLPGDAFSEARAINARGEIVGVSGAAFGSDQSYRAVRWSPEGQISALPMGEGIASEASDINDRGVVTGRISHARGLIIRDPIFPTIWAPDGSFREVVPPEPYGVGEGVALNDLGVMAATIALGDLGHATRAASWSPRDGWRILSPETGDTFARDINVSGTVVGIDLNNPPFPKAVLWRPDGARVDLGLGAAAAINARGWIVGWTRFVASGPRVGVVWSHAGVATPLPSELGFADPLALNDVGEVAGAISTIGPVLWTRGP